MSSRPPRLEKEDASKLTSPLSFSLSFRKLIEDRSIDILQPDVMWLGGLTELLKVSAMAAAYGSSLFRTVALARSPRLVVDRPSSLLLLLLSRHPRCSPRIRTLLVRFLSFFACLPSLVELTSPLFSFPPATTSSSLNLTLPSANTSPTPPMESRSTPSSEISSSTSPSLQVCLFSSSSHLPTLRRELTSLVLSFLQVEGSTCRTSLDSVWFSTPKLV